MAQRKFSRQRESIIENLKMRVDHPTADMIYSDIRTLYPNVSLGTVYRNLALLVDDHEIQKIVSDDGVTHFDYNVKPHEHFVCRKCGAVSDLALLDIEDIRKKCMEKYNGRIDECDVIFYGQCSDCSQKS